MVGKRRGEEGVDGERERTTATKTAPWGVWDPPSNMLPSLPLSVGPLFFFAPAVRFHSLIFIHVLPKIALC